MAALKATEAESTAAVAPEENVDATAAQGQMFFVQPIGAGSAPPPPTVHTMQEVLVEQLVAPPETKPEVEVEAAPETKTEADAKAASDIETKAVTAEEVTVETKAVAEDEQVKGM